MLVCNVCGDVIEDYEIPTRTQCHGHTSLGQELLETIDGNCSCGGEYVEATQCKICGEWFDNEEMHGICECCLEEFETVPVALEMGKEYTEEVEINGFVANALSNEQINKILVKWVSENIIDHSKEVVKYCNEDKEYFSEWIEQKYGD